MSRIEIVGAARRSHNQLGLAYYIAFIRLTGLAPGQQPFEILEDLVGYGKVLVLTLVGGVSPPVPVFSLLFSASYPQAWRSYYLFFNYMLFTTCICVGFQRRN